MCGNGKWLTWLLGQEEGPPRRILLRAPGRSGPALRTWMMSSTSVLPEEVLSEAHVDHVVLPSHLLEVQANELRLVVLNSLQASGTNRNLTGFTLQSDEE